MAWRSFTPARIQSSRQPPFSILSVNVIVIGFRWLGTGCRGARRLGFRGGLDKLGRSRCRVVKIPKEGMNSKNGWYLVFSVNIIGGVKPNRNEIANVREKARDLRGETVGKRKKNPLQCERRNGEGEKRHWSTWLSYQNKTKVF